MATAIMNTTTGIVYVRSISGTLSAGAISATSLTVLGSANSYVADIGGPSVTLGIYSDNVTGFIGLGTRTNHELRVFANNNSNNGLAFSNSAYRIRQGSDTSANRLDVTNTYTTSINNELFSVDWQTQANVALVGTRTAATGTARAVRLVSQDTNAGTSYATLQLLGNATPFARLGFYTAAMANVSTAVTGNAFVIGEYTNVATSGTVVNTAIIPTYNQTSGTAANTDLLINRTQTAVGSGAQRLFDAQVGGATQFYISNVGDTVTAGTLYLSGGARGGISSPADGVVRLLDNAGTGFTRLILGTNDTSGVALKKNSATLQVRLGDDSDYAPLIASGFNATTGTIDLNVAGDVSITRGTGSPEGVLAKAVGSLYIRTDGSSDTTLYVKSTGAGANTGWEAVQTT